MYIKYFTCLSCFDLLTSILQIRKSKIGTHASKLTPEQQEFLDSIPDEDSAKFFQTSKKHSMPKMPLIYRKAGFTQYLTEKGYTMYLTPCGKKVNPSGSRCRQFLSKIIASTPSLNHLSDSVKLASPTKKTELCNGRLRSTAVPKTTTPKKTTTENTKGADPTSTPGKKHSYGFFRTLSPGEHFLATCGSAMMTQFFSHFGDVAKCCLEVDGKPCGGKYCVAGFVDSGTGNEMTCKIACDRCQHERYFGDGSSVKCCKQTSQCGPLHTPKYDLTVRSAPNSTPPKDALTPVATHPTPVPVATPPPRTRTNFETPASDRDTRIRASVGKTLLYNFLLTGKGMYKQYKAIYGRTGDAYGRGTFNAAVKTCMEKVVQVLDEEVVAVEKFLRSKGMWQECYIGVDGSWCTPGASAPHGMFCARSLQAWGGLLGYHFMSRNDPDHPYLMTSASMEVIGCVKVIVCTSHLHIPPARHAHPHVPYSTSSTS